MQLKKIFGNFPGVLFAVILGGLFFFASSIWAGAPPAHNASPSPESANTEGLRAVSSETPAPFPSYGSGPIEVRLYTNYFCGPCRAIEPDVEPLLKELLKKNAIRLILVDFPFDERTYLFAKNFLYALKERNNLEHALRVRDILFEASTNDAITQQEHVEALFKKEGIPFSVFDVEPVFKRYEALIKDGHVKRTPTCVIVKKDLKRRRFSGGPQVVYALNALE